MVVEGALNCLGFFLWLVTVGLYIKGVHLTQWTGEVYFLTEQWGESLKEALFSIES